MKSWGKVWTFALKCVRLPILVNSFVILRINFDIYNKSMIGYLSLFSFTPLNRILMTPARTESQMDLFSTRVPDGSRFVHKSNVEYYIKIYLIIGYNRLQIWRAASTELGIYVQCMLFLAWVLDGSLKKTN